MGKPESLILQPESPILQLNLECQTPFAIILCQSKVLSILSCFLMQIVISHKILTCLLLLSFVSGPVFFLLFYLLFVCIFYAQWLFVVNYYGASPNTFMVRNLRLLLFSYKTLVPRGPIPLTSTCFVNNVHVLLCFWRCVEK